MIIDIFFNLFNFSILLIVGYYVYVHYVKNEVKVLIADEEKRVKSRQALYRDITTQQQLLLEQHEIEKTSHAALLHKLDLWKKHNEQQVLERKRLFAEQEAVMIKNSRIKRRHQIVQSLQNELFANALSLAQEELISHYAAPEHQKHFLKARLEHYTL